MYNASATLYSGCKVNLYLDILQRRSDGYHDLLSLFLPLPEPHDTLVVSPAPTGSGLRLKCLGRSLDGNENILDRTARAFAREAGVTVDLDIVLTKRIPVGAGLGGGSGNAACLLDYLNRSVLPSPLDAPRLHALATTIGADVPFFLQNRPALVQSVGDVLHNVDIPLCGLYGTVVCHDTQISTAWAYATWDRSRNPQSDSLHGMLTGQELQDIFSTLPTIFFYNSFEHVVFPAYPHLRNIKEKLLAFGASGAVLSGSGASIFAIFRDPVRLKAASDWMTQRKLEHYTLMFAES